MMRLLCAPALLLALVLVGAGAQPATATSIDFGQAPVPEGPSASLVVDGVTITGLQSNGTFAADVQRSGKGVGVASGQNAIQSGETAVFDFGSDILLQGFAIFFTCTNCQPGDAPADPFTLDIGDGLTSTSVAFAQTDGPLELLPPTNDPSGANGRWYTYDVAGAPTGSVLEFTGGLNSSFRVKRITFLPEPASALLVGVGLLGIASWRRVRR